jgi:hypothetical protein
MKLWRTILLCALALEIITELTGCNSSVNKINVHEIKLSESDLTIQSGVSKTLVASIEPYFAGDLGIIFVKDDPAGRIKLSNQTRLENPWEYAVTISATPGSNEGEASITAMSLDGSVKATARVTVMLIEYALTVRNLNTESLDTATTADGELKIWKGGLCQDDTALVNKESGARFDWNTTTEMPCFNNSTIAYLTHKDDGSPFTGDFIFRAKIKYSATGISGGAAGFFFGVFRDPTVDPVAAYTEGSENIQKRFRVQGIRVQSNGTVRRYFTSNGGSVTNPRFETPSPEVPALAADTEYILEVKWDGFSTYTNTITFPDETVYAWDVKAGSGNNNILPEMTDPAGSYYPAFYAAGVQLELSELSIAE